MIKTSEDIDHCRRRFFGVAATTIAAAQFGMIGLTSAAADEATPTPLPTIKPGTNHVFAPLKQIDAGVLNVGYAEAGPAGGPASFFCMAGRTTFTALSMSLLCSRLAGYRVIVPYLRGYGTTRFLSSRHGPKRAAIGARCRHHRLDGCSEDPEGDHWRVRLGRADGRHHGGALAGALQGPRLR